MSSLHEILDVDLPPASNQAQLPAPAIETPDVSGAANNTVNQDATDARHAIRTLIAQGTTAVSELLALARNSGTPRAYEVAANMLKTMAELNHDLMQVHQEERALVEVEDAPEVHNHFENAVFVGSTSDLGELVKQRRAQRNANTITVEAKTISGVQVEAGGAEVLPQEPTT